MKLDFCVLCGCKENLHHHHVIPKVKGGTDDEDNFITLCEKHHHMIHNMLSSVDMYELCRIGREKAKNKGVKFGKKRTFDKYQVAEIMSKRSEGQGYGTIAKSLGMNRGTVQKIINREKVDNT
jgi:hypothetical protein